MERGRVLLSRLCFLIYRRSGQQKERTTGGADSRSSGQLGVQRERTAGGAWGVDSEEDNGRRGQPQGWILKRMSKICPTRTGGWYKK